jgi:hypothetical protein
MQDLTIIVLLITVVLLIIYRTRSLYTSDQLSSLMQFSNPYFSPTTLNDLCDMIINQIKGLPVLTSVNNLISTVNANGVTPPLVPYTSESQIKTMFESAYANGEASLTRTDRTILRIFSVVGIEFARAAWGTASLPTLTYMSDGRPSWADEITRSSGLTVDQTIIKVFELVKNYSPTPGEQGGPPGFFTAVNELLPAGVTPFASNEDMKNRMSSDRSDPAVTYYIKYVTLGPLYIAWVAENKWRLDPGFRL